MRLLLLLALAGCDLVGPTFEGINERPLDPPDTYAVWYAEVSACMGTDYGRPFETVRWFVVDSFDATGLNIGEVVAAVWTYPDEIAISDGYLSSRAVVKHEVIHHLRGTKGQSENGPVFALCS